MYDSHVDTPAPSEYQLELMRERMYAFIFPNVPQTDGEKEAFEKAVEWQYEHDYSIMQRLNEDIPEGVKSFKIGDFQMAFKDGVLEYRLTRQNVCPSAYGLLLRTGLLYRGVEGRLPYAAD